MGVLYGFHCECRNADARAFRICSFFFVGLEKGVSECWRGVYVGGVSEGWMFVCVSCNRWIFLEWTMSKRINARIFSSCSFPFYGFGEGEVSVRWVLRDGGSGMVVW